MTDAPLLHADHVIGCLDAPRLELVAGVIVEFEQECPDGRCPHPNRLRVSTFEPDHRIEQYR